MIATLFGANAQTVSADFSSLDKLVEKLAKACAKSPKACGEADIDLLWMETRMPRSGLWRLPKNSTHSIPVRLARPQMEYRM